MRRALCGWILAFFGLAAFAQETPPAPTEPASGPPRVRVDTSMGSFTLRLDPDRAPISVENFLRYVREGFYDGTIFHRVVDGFVVQGGGYLPDYTAKETHEQIPNEAGNGLPNRRGSVGMARTEKPHSAAAQFFINLADNPDLNPLPSRWGYAVFGEVIEGMDVVERIGHVPTGAAGPFKDSVPLKPIVIEKVTLLE